MKRSCRFIGRVLTIGLMLVGAANTITAQYSETIRSDRPGQANSSYSIGKGMLQVQSGIDFEENQILPTTWTNLKSNTVVRYGVGERIDINGSVDVARQKNSQTGIEKWHPMFFHSWTLGTRVNFLEGKGAVPAVAVQASVFGPFRGLGLQDVGATMLLSATETLSKRFSLLVNLGVTDIGYASRRVFYVVNLGYSISPKLSTYIENYGNVWFGTLVNRWDGGFAYLLRNNLQLDLYGGLGRNSSLVDYLVSGGVSWRMPIKKVNTKE